MKVRRILSTALAAALMFSSSAYAADTTPKERIVTTQNGTGYTVSSVGQHVIPVDDSSHSFVFAPTDGYDLNRLVITDGQHTDHADVSKLEQNLKLNGVSYPVDYQSKTDAYGTSVIRATVAIPAAQDSVTLSAEAISTECNITASAQSGATVSSSSASLHKGDSYSMTAKPDGRLYRISRADLTIGKSKTSIALQNGCDVTSQGYRFTMDAEGVLTVYCGGVRQSASIELKTEERTPDSDEVLVSLHTGRGIDSNVLKDIVKKGSSFTASFSAERGYVIDTLTLEADGQIAYSTPNTNTVFVGKNAYRISGNADSCTVYLTDLQSNITVTAESEYDSEQLLVETSAGSGTRIEKNCGSTVDLGTDVDFEIFVTDKDRYTLDKITLRVGNSSRTVSANETTIRIDGQAYQMETDQDGVVHLYVTDIDKPIYVSATAERARTTHKVMVEESPNLTIGKNTGYTVSHGNDVKFVIKPFSGYAVNTITLQLGSHTQTVSANASKIILNGTDYAMERDASGNITLYVDNVYADVTLSATASMSSNASGSNGKICIDRTVKNPFYIGYNSHFYPKSNITRAEAVQLLSRMTNMNKDNIYPNAGFSDILLDSYYTNALNAFVHGGIVKVGTPYFMPNQPITRAEFVSMIYRLDTVNGYSSDIRFYDVPQTAPYAAAVAYCSDRAWITGYSDGSFRPMEYITRAEAAAVVNRTMGRTLATSDFSGVHYDDVPESYWAYNDILIASSTQR